MWQLRIRFLSLPSAWSLVLIVGTQAAFIKSTPPTHEHILLQTLDLQLWMRGAQISQTCFHYNTLTLVPCAQKNRPSIWSSGCFHHTWGLRSKVISLNRSSRNFPSGPVTRAPHSRCRGPEFNPWLGNKIPQATAKDSTCCSWDPAQPNK